MLSVNFLSCPFNLGSPNKLTALGCLQLSRFFKSINCEAIYHWIIKSYSAFFSQMAGILAFEKFFLPCLTPAPNQRNIFINGDHFSTFFCFLKMQALVANLKIVWFDSHPDLNTPKTTPSGNLHGMTLSALLGRQNRQLTRLVQHPLRFEDIILVSPFDIDPGEEVAIKKHNIMVLSLEKFSTLKLNCPVYVSFDFDSIKFEDFPAVNTVSKSKNSLSQVETALISFIKSNDVVAIDFNEFDPGKDPNLDCFKTAISLIQRLSFEGL